MMKRALSIFLTGVFLLGLLPTAALAAEPDSGGLCPHHQEHSFEDCGFIEAVEGQPCGHIHDVDCGYVEAAEEIPCNMDCAEPNEGGQIVHGEGCAYAPEVEGVPCQHEHDDECGYVPADLGQLCGYVCPVCPVQAMIDALSAPEDIAAENRAWVEAQLEAIGEAWAELFDEDALRLDTTRLEAAWDALAALDGQAGNELPAPLADTVDTNYQKPVFRSDKLTGFEPASEAATVVTEADADTGWRGGWYVVSGNVEIPSRITVSGDVHLILTDGCNLTANGGINVNRSLTIYGQQNGTGTLTAKGGNTQAGIGGNDNETSGTITINGGDITARGGDNGAGIGGGGKMGFGDGGNITINGGSVIANSDMYGGNGASIGGGRSANGGNIIITGGYVTANGWGIGAGGGGSGGSFSTGGNGNAFITAERISDKSNQNNWSGVIFEGNEGKVYGSPELKEDATIPNGKTLTIENGKTLTIASGVTLTNNGTIKIEQGGTLSNSGTLTGNGTITGSGQLTGTKASQTAPGEGEGYAINCTTEQITIENGYRVSSDKLDTIADGPIDPGRQLHVRKMENNFYNASDWTDFTTPSRGTTPSVSIDYMEEELNTTAAMQYVIRASGHGVQSWESCTSDMAATAFGNWNGSTEVTVQFRTAATQTNYASEAQEVTIPIRPTAPSSLQGQSTSFAGESDGEITGLIAGTAYQISSNDGTNWADATLTETKITGLASGNYRVRVKATTSTFASKASEAVKVESGPSRTYELEVTAPTFDAVPYGYTQPTAKAITITSSGNSDATISKVEVSNTSKFIIGGSGSTVTAGGFIDTWTIQPNTGLSAGEHTATITVAYDGGAEATTDVKFKVNGVPQAAPAAPELESKTYHRVTLKAVDPNINGAVAQYSNDGGKTWQTSPEFTGLTPSTRYTFVVRYGASGNYEASPASPALEVATEAAPVTTYLVTVNGGTGGGSYAEDATVTITADAAPDGQRFTGWTVDAGGVILTNASSATTTFTMPAQAVTVTANFETIITPPTEYTVTFDAQGGNVAPATVKTTVGKLQSLPVPTKSSHTFEGWFTQSSGGEKITVDNVFTADTTIYAHWKYTGGNSGNNSGGYTPPTTTYPPTVEKPQGGGGTAAVFPSRPERGDTVIVTPKPDEGYEVDKITVTDQNGKPVEVTVRPDGTYTFKQPSGKVTIEVSYKAVEKPWNNPFADVSEGDWYYETVRFVQEQGLMNGYNDGRFGANDTLSRAQLAQILFNKEGRPGVNYLLDFSDVADEAWYTEAVRWATSQGIVGGYGNGTFGPNDPITREQLAVMLWRYSGSPAATNKELHFNDTDEISGFALEALRWAVENGILNGYGDGRLGLQGQATRAQVAQMLKNFIEKG